MTKYIFQPPRNAEIGKLDRKWIWPLNGSAETYARNRRKCPNSRVADRRKSSGIHYVGSVSIEETSKVVRFAIN